jgi:hypothetical protein
VDPLNNTIEEREKYIFRLEKVELLTSIFRKMKEEEEL